MKPRILDYYTLCTVDCVEGEHTGQWIECDRCGAPTHVRIFEVEHPQYGRIRVGRECFKDVMGYTFKKAHEKALETLVAINRWVDDFDDGPSSPGRIVLVGLPEAKSGYKYIPVWFCFENGRCDNSYNWDFTLRSQGIRPHPLAPYGWSKSIINAGLDLGLWKYREDAGVDLPKYFKSPLVVEVP